MAHYAFLDENNVVTEVIAGNNESIDTDWEVYYSQIRGQTCKRTSYNTIRGTHINGGVPYRKNYAGVGYTYDVERDAFISPEPNNAIGFDEDKCQWIVPEVDIETLAE